jgi:hypothetical protein
MAKEATVTAAPAIELRELLPLKTTQATVNRVDHVLKQVILQMEDSISFADLMADPKLFRVIQKDRSKALNALDEVILVWFDRIVETRVDYADDQEVVLFKATTLNRRERDRTPWQNETYEVRAIQGMWSFFRRKDQQQIGRLYSTPELARQACITETGSVRV